jgi:hypothetical protein
MTSLKQGMYHKSTAAVQYDELLYGWIFVCSRLGTHNSSLLGQNKEFYYICIITPITNLLEKSVIFQETLHTERKTFNTS